jgi:hypothetical protein
VEELRRQLRERDDEIVKLRRQLEELRSSQDDEVAGALETALVRQGGRVLPRRAYELEPQVLYFYDEPVAGQRRDTWIAALELRAGLGRLWQAEIRIPYVIEDRWADVGTSSGAGDIRLGLTKELLSERPGRPSVLVFGQWRTTTGDINTTPSTGFDQDALQAGLTLTKRQDPVVLFASASYIENFGSARLANGSEYSSGDALAARLGVHLAATPATSLYSGVSFLSSSGDTVNGAVVPETDRLLGIVELAATTAVGRGKFLAITGSIGFTSAAPKFGLAVSFPIRLD